MGTYRDEWAIVASNGKSHGPVKKARLAFYHQHNEALKAKVMVHHVMQPPGEAMPLAAYLAHWANPDNAVPGKFRQTLVVMRLDMLPDHSGCVYKRDASSAMCCKGYGSTQGAVWASGNQI